MKTHHTLQLKNSPAMRRGQQGVVMFVALVVLIVMTLAGLAMMRQLGAGSSIAGNIAFKQAATAVADVGVETARNFIGTNVALLDADQPAQGYYATWGSNNVDPASAVWDPLWNAPAPLIFAPNGERVMYIIQRLCAASGPINGPGQQCSDSIARNRPGSSNAGLVGGRRIIPPPPLPFYRVTTRVDGTRNARSYTQVLLN
jgi:type IV pilus assembly protein PilX